MIKPASIAARILAGVFFCVFSHSAFPCDGISDTCPATQKSGLRWRYAGHSYGSKSMPASGYVYETHSQAISASCSALQGLFQSLNYSDGCSSGTYSVTSCPHTVVIGSSTSASFKFDHNFVQSQCGGSTSTQNFTSSSGSQAQTTTYYACENPQYPIGPDASNLCHKPTCQAGQRFNSWLSDDGSQGEFYAGPDGASSYCQEFVGPSGVAEKCLVSPSSGGLCSGGRCTYDYVTQTGQSCETPDTNSDGGSGNPCSTYADGGVACDSDGSANQENSSPGNNGTGSRCINYEGRQYCIDVTPANDNCAANPNTPECQAPVEQNCTFVGGKYYCADADNSCGTFNGVSLCICDDGSVQQTADACSDYPDGTGPGIPGDGTGSGSNGYSDGVSKQVNEDFPTLTKPTKIEGLEEFQGKLGEKPQSNIGSFASGFEPFSLPSGGCGALDIPNPLGGSFSLQPPCQWMEVLRGFFGVVFVVLTIARCRNRILEAV